MDNEIRIPVTVELQAKNGGENKKVISKEKQEDKSQNFDLTSVINTQLIVGTTRKLIAANGNSQSARNVGLAMKFGNMGVGLVKGIRDGGTKFGVAAVAIAMEALEQVVKANAEAKQNRQIKNQSLYNQVFRGDIWLEQGVNMTYNKYGDLQFTRK